MHMRAHIGSEASTALAAIAKTGYAARGVVYLLVGVLVLWSCWIGRSSQAPDSRGALAELGAQRFGTVALWLVAAGLVAYALWRVVQVVRDPDRHGRDAKGIAVRFSLAASAVIHLSLAYSAATIAQGLGDSGGQRGWTDTLLSQSWGQWLVALIGAAIVGAGIAQVVKGWKGGFMKYFDVDRAALGVLYGVCRLGLAARGLVFVIIGGLLVQAAARYGPGRDDGLRGAFQAILDRPHGVALLALVGVGLLAFAVYSFVEARHRRVHA